MRESNLGRQIQIWCGEHDLLCIRYNTGTVQDAKTGRYIDFGPPKGHPDYIIYTRHGQIMFVEIKVGHNKQSEEQVNFMNVVRSRGFVYLVVYSLSDLITNPLLSQYHAIKPCKQSP